MKLLGPARLALLDDRDHLDHLVVDAALDEAFAPLRARTANIAAARVRAAVRWSRSEPRALHGLALVARIGELSVAAVFSAFLFGASLASVAPAVPDAWRDAASAGGLVLNGRTALQWPIGSRATDDRMTGGDLADNAATVRRQATRTNRAPVRTSSDQ